MQRVLYSGPLRKQVIEALIYGRSVRAADGLRRSFRREQRKKSTVEVVADYVDVTRDPEAFFDKRGRIVGGHPGDTFRQWAVGNIDLTVTRPDGTRLVVIGEDLDEVGHAAPADGTGKVLRKKEA